MLIALNFPDAYTGHVKFAEELIKDVKGKFTILMPKTLEEYNEAVKKYRPKKTVHLILLVSHHKWLKGASDGVWRAAEYTLATRGGAVWGDDPGRASLTYAGSFLDQDRILVEAGYRGQRAMLFDSLSRKYLGRTDSDPHTAIVGFVPSYPRLAQVADLFLSGFPLESSKDTVPSEWWEGVAFLDKAADGPLEKTLHWLEDSRILAIGDAASARLTALNVEHGTLPEVSKLLKVKKIETAKSVGRMVRETARTYDDNREWRP